MKNCNDQSEAFAKYHIEHAKYGGASREFHELAASFLRSIELDRNAWREQHENATACWKQDNATLLASVQKAEQERDTWKDRYESQLEDIESLNKLCENWYDKSLKFERLYGKALAQVIRLRNILRADPSGTAKTWDWKHWRASIMKVCLKAEADRDKYLEALKLANFEISKLTDERNVASASASMGTWVWSDTDSNDVESMSEEMTVTMTAGQLRKLLNKQPVTQKCSHCNGEGWRDGWPCRLPCYWCDGTGKVVL